MKENKLKNILPKNQGVKRKNLIPKSGGGNNKTDKINGNSEANNSIADSSEIKKSSRPAVWLKLITSKITNKNLPSTSIENQKPLSNNVETINQNDRNYTNHNEFYNCDRSNEFYQGIMRDIPARAQSTPYPTVEHNDTNRITHSYLLPELVLSSNLSLDNPSYQNKLSEERLSPKTPCSQYSDEYEGNVVHRDLLCLSPLCHNHEAPLNPNGLANSHADCIYENVSCNEKFADHLKEPNFHNKYPKHSHRLLQDQLIKKQFPEGISYTERKKNSIFRLSPIKLNCDKNNITDDLKAVATLTANIPRPVASPLIPETGDLSVNSHLKVSVYDHSKIIKPLISVKSRSNYGATRINKGNTKGSLSIDNFSDHLSVRATGLYTPKESNFKKSNLSEEIISLPFDKNPSPCKSPNSQPIYDTLSSNILPAVREDPIGADATRQQPFLPSNYAECFDSVNDKGLYEVKHIKPPIPTERKKSMGECNHQHKENLEKHCEQKPTEVVEALANMEKQAWFWGKLSR